MKICKVCKQSFEPSRPMARVCSLECAKSLAISDRLKAEKVASIKERKADKVKREKLKSRADWAREAQAAFNAYIRLRDADLPCISCGRHHTGQYHAGHYLSVGARPELRFNEFNVNKQCAQCNTYNSGNIAKYRLGLIEKQGLEVVEALEGPHLPMNYSIDALKEIKLAYGTAARELRKAQE